MFVLSPYFSPFSPSFVYFSYLSHSPDSRVPRLILPFFIFFTPDIIPPFFIRHLYSSHPVFSRSHANLNNFPHARRDRAYEPAFTFLHFLRGGCRKYRRTLLLSNEVKRKSCNFSALTLSLTADFDTYHTQHTVGIQSPYTLRTISQKVY